MDWPLSNLVLSLLGLIVSAILVATSIWALRAYSVHGGYKRFGQAFPFFFAALGFLALITLLVSMIALVHCLF